MKTINGNLKKLVGKMKKCKLDIIIIELKQPNIEISEMEEMIFLENERSRGREFSKQGLC